MNPRWMFVALTSALVGCPDARTATCNDDPTLAECVIDGGTVGGLTYRTHPRKIGLDYVPVQVGACGSYLREIDWQMPGGAPDDGYIVQQIQVSWSGVCPTRDEQALATCDVDVPAACLDESGTPDYPPAELEFWEAWRILRGTETPAADAVRTTHGAPTRKQSRRGASRSSAGRGSTPTHTSDPSARGWLAARGRRRLAHG